MTLISWMSAYEYIIHGQSERIFARQPWNQRKHVRPHGLWGANIRFVCLTNNNKCEQLEGKHVNDVNIGKNKFERGEGQWMHDVCLFLARKWTSQQAESKSQHLVDLALVALAFFPAISVGLQWQHLRREERKPGECEGGCEEEGEEEGGCGKQNRSRRGGARNAPAFVSLHPLPNVSIVLPMLTRVLYQFILPFHQFFQCFAMVLLDFSIITLMLPQCV